MKKLLNWLDVNFEAVLMVLFFTLMIALVTVQVILRFVFENGLHWGEEVSRILFVWMSFSAFGYLARNGRHVRVGFLVGKLPDGAQKVLMLICDLLFLAFSVVGLKSAWSLSMDAIKYQDMMVAVPWNWSVLYFAGVLGFVMMVIRNIQVIVWRFANWKADLKRFTNYDGAYYKNNKICFEPAKKDELEQLEQSADEMGE